MSTVGHIDAREIVKLLTAGELSRVVGTSRPRRVGAIAEFIAHRTVRLPEATVRVDVLHRAFVRWCGEERARSLSYAEFRVAVQAEGAQVIKRGFAEWFVGIGLHASVLEPDE